MGEDASGQGRPDLCTLQWGMADPEPEGGCDQRVCANVGCPGMPILYSILLVCVFQLLNSTGILRG